MPNPGISFFIEKKSSKLKLMPKLGIRTGVRPIDDTMKYQDSWPEYQEYHAILEYQAEYQQNTTNENTRHYE